MKTKRLIAIGDIHGEMRQLDSLLNKLQLQKEDTVVFLGDYIDRGRFSRQVITRLIQLSKTCRCIFLMGNHEKMLLEAYLDKSETSYNMWMMNGGVETVESYGTYENIFATHLEFFKSLKYYYKTDKYFFVHAGVNPDKTLDEQDKNDFLWIRFAFIDHPHKLKQKIIYGHTPVEEPLIEVDKICIDTGCGKFENAKLTAFICDEEKFIFSD